MPVPRRSKQVLGGWIIVPYGDVVRYSQNCKHDHWRDRDNKETAVETGVEQTRIRRDVDDVEVDEAEERKEFLVLLRIYIFGNGAEL